MTPGQTVRNNVRAAQMMLNGSPTTAAEWQTVARQLRRAADAARVIVLVAERMALTPAPLSPDGRYLGL